MDFMSVTIMGMRKFRTFNVMDDCTREALAIEIDTLLSSKRIIRTLESVIAWRGKPKLSERTTALNSLPKF
jgi:putative transposase